MKNNKNIENKLKQRFEDFEVKPSEFLWDKIESNLADKNFENTIQNKLEGFTVNPTDKTWLNIESKLPETNYKKRRIIYFTLFGFLLGITFTTGFYFFKQNEEKISLKNEIITQNNNPESIENVLAKNSNSKKSAQANKYKLFNAKNEGIVNKKVDSINYKNSSNIKNVSLLLEPYLIDNLKSTTQNQNVVSYENKVMKDESNELNNSETQVNFNSNESNKNDLINKSVTELPSINSAIVLKNYDSLSQAKPASNVNVYSSPDEILTKFGITVLAGYQFTGISIGITENKNLEKAYNLRKSMEKASADWTGGFLADYYVNEKLIISSGILINNARTGLTYNLANPSGNNDSLRVQPGYAYLHSADSVVSGTTRSLQNTFSFTELPFRLTYLLISNNSKLKFTANSGFSYAFLTSINTYVPDASCVGLLQIADKNQFPEYRNIIFIFGGAGLMYQFSNTISLGLEVAGKSSLNNMVKNKNWYIELPYMFGSNLILRKRF
ncbi:MAG: hypothetical protein ACK4K9_02025 [Bacteroidia bacterium]